MRGLIAGENLRAEERRGYDLRQCEDFTVYTVRSVVYINMVRITHYCDALRSIALALGTLENTQHIAGLSEGRRIHGATPRDPLHIPLRRRQRWSPLHRLRQIVASLRR